MGEGVSTTHSEGRDGVVNKVLLAFLIFCFAVQAFAIDGEAFDDPNMEARYQFLMHELRCPKCQNQNIADSDAPIAADFRREVRAMLKEGRTDQEIKQFLVDRYGDFILYRPPMATRTMALWLAPGLALLAAIASVLVVVRRRMNKPLDDPPDDGVSESQTP